MVVDCGGGIGGPPTSEINAKKIYDCKDVEKALVMHQDKVNLQSTGVIKHVLIQPIQIKICGFNIKN